jgi:Fur family ferric uptake transcriptional regulator
MNEGLSPRAKKLRDAGHKLTNARLAVLQAIEEHGGHITSTEVLDAVSRLAPEVGRASIFRTLDLLTRMAIVRPTYIDSSITPSYVLMPDGHHHHIICTSCSRVIEFEDCHLAHLEQELEARLNVQLTGHLLEFYGICERCQS